MLRNQNRRLRSTKLNGFDSLEKREMFAGFGFSSYDFGGMDSGTGQIADFGDYSGSQSADDVIVIMDDFTC